MPVSSSLRFFLLLVVFVSYFFTPNISLASSTESKKINVPFTLQAPQSKWVQPWADACEEATIVMIDRFYRGDTSKRINVNTAISEMNTWFKLENKLFNYNKDTNAEQTMRLINEFSSWEAYKVFKPTTAMIKAEIDNKRPVIALVSGKSLKNKYFRNGGPDYHMFVIKGYNDLRGEFIVNDPGFGKGLDFGYPYGTLLASLHDFVPGGKTSTGEQLVLFTQPHSTDSNSTDGDSDGLTKEAEISQKTSLFSPDTDQDGYLDGEEVSNGYSPLTNESTITVGALVRTATEPTVYFIGVGEKFPIASPEVLANHGWDMNRVIVVSQRFLDSFTARPVLTE